MGNCKSKAKSDVVEAQHPVDKGAFRFDKDARQIVYVGEDAATAEITAIGSSQSGEDATNEGDSNSMSTTNPANDAFIEKSLLGEITEFLEHDGDNSTVYTQTSRGRNSPSLLFNSPNYTSHPEGFRDHGNSSKERTMVDFESPRNSVSPLGLEPDIHDGDSVNRFPYVIHTNPSEDETEQTDSSTLNGLRHVHSEETYDTLREQVEDIGQSILLMKSSSSESEESSVYFVSTKKSRSPHQDQDQIHDSPTLEMATNRDIHISQMFSMDDSADNIQSSLQQLQGFHRTDESTNQRRDMCEDQGEDDYEYDEGYIPLTKSRSKEASEGYESDDEISKISGKEHSEYFKRNDTIELAALPINEYNLVKNTSATTDLGPLFAFDEESGPVTGSSDSEQVAKSARAASLEGLGTEIDVGKDGSLGPDEPTSVAIGNPPGEMDQGTNNKSDEEVLSDDKSMLLIEPGIEENNKGANVNANADTYESSMEKSGIVGTMKYALPDVPRESPVAKVGIVDTMEDELLNDEQSCLIESSVGETQDIDAEVGIEGTMEDVLPLVKLLIEPGIAETNEFSDAESESDAEVNRAELSVDRPRLLIKPAEESDVDKAVVADANAKFDEDLNTSFEFVQHRMEALKGNVARKEDCSNMSGKMNTDFLNESSKVPFGESELDAVSISQHSVQDISFGETTLAPTNVSDTDNGLSFDEGDDTDLSRDETVKDNIPVAVNSLQENNRKCMFPVSAPSLSKEDRVGDFIDEEPHPLMHTKTKSAALTANIRDDGGSGITSSSYVEIAKMNTEVKENIATPALSPSESAVNKNEYKLQYQEEILPLSFSVDDEIEVNASCEDLSSVNRPAMNRGKEQGKSDIGAEGNEVVMESLVNADSDLSAHLDCESLLISPVAIPEQSNVSVDSSRVTVDEKKENTAATTIPQFNVDGMSSSGKEGSSLEELQASVAKRKTFIPRVSQNSPLKGRSPYQGTRKTLMQTPSPSRSRKYNKTPPRSSTGKPGSVNKSPVPTRGKSPVPTSRKSPVPAASRKSPVPASRKSPLPVSRKSPVPISRKSPLPVSRKSPLPASRKTPENQISRSSSTVNSDLSAGSYHSEQNTPKSLPWDEKEKHRVRGGRSSRQRAGRISIVNNGNKSQCVTKWEPYVHETKGGCERCLTLCSQKEREDFFKYGRHQRITRTSGGCTNYCTRYAGQRFYESETVVLCRICFHAVHRNSRTKVKDSTIRSLSSEYSDEM